MTNFSNDELIEERDTHGARLAADLTKLFAAPVPNLTFQRPAEPIRRGRPSWLSIRTAAIAVSAIALAVAVTLLAVRPWNGAAEISAAEILARASRVAAGRIEMIQTESYHIFFHARDPFSDGTQLSRPEIWYDGPDRYRIEIRSWFNRPDGNVSYSDPSDSLHGTVVNGDDAWIYHQQSVCPGELPGARNCDGVLRAVHLPSSELEGSPSNFSDQPENLPDIVASYSTDACRDVKLLDDKLILLGRTVYTILITPRPGCTLYDEGLADLPELRDADGRILIPGVTDTKVTKVMVYVDKETFLTLQADYERADMIEVHPSTYEKDPELPDSTFDYEPPEGVTVQEVDTFQQAREAIGPPVR